MRGGWSHGGGRSVTSLAVIAGYTPAVDVGIGVDSATHVDPGLAIVQTNDFELNPIQFNSTQFRHS